MLTPHQYNKLAHDLKLSAQVLKFVRDETDHEKRQAFISLLINEFDRLSGDIEDLKGNVNG